MVSLTHEEKLICGKAADLVAKGWCQKAYRRRNIRTGIYQRCLISALSAAGCQFWLPYFEAMRERGIEDPIGWNDAPERTKAEVIALLGALQNA